MIYIMIFFGVLIIVLVMYFKCKLYCLFKYWKEEMNNSLGNLNFGYKCVIL